MAGADDAVSLVELVDERRHLLDVALWMLGSGREAERVIDEAYRQWFGLPEAERTRILEPRSWLCRAVGGACLSRLASPGQCGAGADAVGGVLVDSSSPADRARRSLRARRGRPTSVEEHDAVVRAVREACAREDERQLASLLTADTAAFFDGGGKVRALVRPVEGKRPVARSLLTLLARHPGPRWTRMRSTAGPGWWCTTDVRSPRSSASTSSDRTSCRSGSPSTPTNSGPGTTRLARDVAPAGASTAPGVPEPLHRSV